MGHRRPGKIRKILCQYVKLQTQVEKQLDIAGEKLANYIAIVKMPKSRDVQSEPVAMKKRTVKAKKKAMMARRVGKVIDIKKATMAKIVA
jgi:hypothetical protein